MVRKVPSFDVPPVTPPFSTPQWIHGWHETIGKDWELLILSVDEKIIAPFGLNKNEVIFAGGYEVADYLDIIGPDSFKQNAWEEILTYLKGEGVTSIHLNNIPENSPTISFFKSHASTVIKEEDTTPIMSLPPVLDKKYRHEMERKIRKFEREYPDIQFVEGHNIEILLSLMKLDPRKKEFFTPDMESFFRTIHSMGTITELIVGNKPAAAILAFRNGDTIMGYNSGFDELNFSGSGYYLKAKHIIRAEKSGTHTYNFLQGNERYKYELGGKDFFVYKIDVAL